MSEFDLTIIHVPEKANIVADSLLHRADLDPAKVVAVSVSVESDLLAIIRLVQEQDSLDAFRNLKYHALDHFWGMCIYDGLFCRMLFTSG